MTYSLENLPEDIKNIFLTRYVAVDPDAHRKNVSSYYAGHQGLFASPEVSDNEKDSDEADGKTKAPEPEYEKRDVLWATNNYETLGEEYASDKPVHDLSVIVPRTGKNKDVQRLRSRMNAEVFTPSWMCNLQNNLIDDDFVYPNAFNTVDETQKIWTPTEEFIDFDSEKTDKTIKQYLTRRSLEITCGEAPYLMSPYDTTTGKEIPIRDSEGRFKRIGLLDRKMRVVAEGIQKEIGPSMELFLGADPKTIRDLWLANAMVALNATYGYEWHGDNLLLARLNFLNTFVDYYEDFLNHKPENSILVEVAEIAAWNIWQMDGLKMVAPNTCSNSCKACKKGSREYVQHDGELAVIKFHQIMAFEDVISY